MSIFDKIATSRVFEQGNWFKPGIYDVVLSDISSFDSGQGKGPMVACRFHVEKCTPTEYTTEKDFPPGSSASCVYVLQSQVGPSNLKAFLIAAGKALAVQRGMDPAAVNENTLTKADYEKFCSPGSPIVGLSFTATCFTKKSKAGKDFVAITWKAREG